MTKRFYILTLLMAFTFVGMNAQDDSFNNGGISDEMTKDPEQNKMWRMGQTKYNAKPKSAWELGVHVGHFFIDGDVDRTISWRIRNRFTP